jgi:hypothetical protein
MDLSFLTIFFGAIRSGAIPSAVCAKVLQFINSCLVPALPGCPPVPVPARLTSFRRADGGLLLDGLQGSIKNPRFSPLYEKRGLFSIYFVLSHQLNYYRLN